MAKKSTCLAGAKRRRVLYIITKSVWGGAAKYVYDLSLNLSGEFEIAIAAGGKDKLYEKIKQTDIPYYQINSFQRDINIFKEFLAGFEILSLFFQIKPDIIHANSSKAGGLVGLAGLIYKLLSNKKIKLIFTAHGWAINEDRSEWQIKLIKLFSKITCLFYDKIICVSEYDRKIAIKNNIASDNKLVSIHNGIDINKISFFDKKEAREKIIQNSKFKIQNSIVIGTLAEWTKNKGLIYLLKAVKKLQNPSTRFARSGNKKSNLYPEFVERYKFDIILIGSGENPDKIKIRQFIEKHRLENVHLIEFIPNAVNYFKAFDIFILPSIKEGLPYTIIEAMVAELPIIATNVGGIPEMTENNINGILIEPKNPDIIGEKILYIINNPKEAKQMAQKAKQKAEQEFCLKKMLEKTKNIY